MQTAKNKGQRSAVNLKTKGDVHIASCLQLSPRSVLQPASQKATPSCYCVQNAHVNSTIVSASGEVSARPLRNVFSCEFALQKSLLRRANSCGRSSVPGVCKPKSACQSSILGQCQQHSGFGRPVFVLSGRHAENCVSTNSCCVWHFCVLACKVGFCFPVSDGDAAIILICRVPQ